MQDSTPAAVLVVHAKRNDLAVRHGAATFLYWLAAAVRRGRDIERAVERHFIGADRERAWVRRDGGGTHTRPVYDRVGKTGGRTGVGKHVHDDDEVSRTGGAGKGKDISDVNDRVGDRARSGNVVRHLSIPLFLPHPHRPTNSARTSSA